MHYPGFINGDGRVRSPNVDVERTVNLFPEMADAGTPKVRANLYGTPGLSPFAYLLSGPVRALFGQDGRCFAVGGAGFYEIFPQRTVTQRGLVVSDGRPATISSNGTNGHQLLVTSGGHGYIFDLTANTFTEITDDGFPTPVAMGLFVDTYFLVLKSGSNQFNWSSPLDGTTWNALDVAQTSLSSDQKKAIAVSHRSVFVLGEKYTEVWVDTGGSSTFQPQPGTFIEHGIEAPFSCIVIDNTLIWLGRDEGGSGVVWKLNGYTPQRVSTHAVEYALSQATSLEPSIAYYYQEDGHSFYVLYVPSLPTTWVYDVATNLWHERALWNPKTEQYEPHLSRCHCYAFNRNLVGDRQSRTVYHMSLNYLDDTVVIGAGAAA